MPVPPYPEPKINRPLIASIEPQQIYLSQQPQTLQVFGTGFIPGLTVELLSEEKVDDVIGGDAIQDLTTDTFSLTVSGFVLDGSYSLLVRTEAGFTSNAYPFLVLQDSPGT